MSVYSKGSRPPPGLLPPPSPGQMSQPASAISRATHSSLQGTSIDHKGVCAVNLVVDDLEIPFMAVRDSVRFLNSMYPDWSMPAFVGGVSLPNEVGATYSIEHYEKTVLDAYDGDDKEIQVKRKKLITIKDIMNQARFKVITFDVVSRIESDIVTEPFAPTSYIVVEIKAFPYEQGKYQFTVTFDGGPPDVETSYFCICFAMPSSLKKQEDAQELRPKIYAQASSVMNYIKNFNPNTPVARQVHATNAQNQHMMDSRAGNNSRFGSKGGNSAAMYSYDDDINSQSGSKVSKNSKGSRGFEYQSPAMAHVQQVMRSDSSNHYQSGWSTGTPPQSPSSADEIRKLYDLLNIGAITKHEFEIEKKKLLGRANEF